MAQVLGADSVNGAANQALANAAPVNVVTGNFLNPPFGNAKVTVRFWCGILLGSIPTSINFSIFRNPSGENVNVRGSGAITAPLTASSFALFEYLAIDLIPDGRPVQYAGTVTVNGTGTANQCNYSQIEAMILSG